MRYIGLPWGWALVRKHTTPGSGTGARGLCRNTKPVARKSKAITDFSSVPHTITRNVKYISSSRMWCMNIPLP